MPEGIRVRERRGRRAANDAGRLPLDVNVPRCNHAEVYRRCRCLSTCIRRKVCLIHRAAGQRMAGKDAFTDVAAPSQCRTAQFIKAGERFRTDRCTVIPSCIQKEVFTITRYMNSFEERQFIHYCGGNQLLHAILMQVDDNGVFTIQKQE